MQTDESLELVRFLLTSSRSTLGDFELHYLNEGANAEQELKDTLHRIVYRIAWAMVARLLREHGEEILEVLSSPRRPGPG